MLFDQLQFLGNFIIALFILRWLQIHLVQRDSQFGKALSYLIH